MGSGAIFLIGLLTFGLTYALFNNDDSDEMTSDSDPEEETEEILISEGGNFETGPEDDIIRTSREVDEPLAISTGEGDDFVEARGWDTTINGGPGADTLIGQGAYVEIQGGPGDDQIEASDMYRNEIFGGTGNDIFALDLGSSEDEASSVSGGAGDDRFDVSVDTTTPYTEGLQTNVLSGGSGTDEFNITLNIRDPFFESDETEIDLSEALLISDFDPNEDTLLIDLSGNENFDLVDAEIDNGALTLSFADIEGRLMQSEILLPNSAATMADIQFLVSESEEGVEVVIDEDSPSLIETRSGDDTVTSEADRLSGFSILTGAGNDSVNLQDTLVEFSTITTADGNDTVVADRADDGVDIDAGAGDDIVRTTAYGSNILGGEGDDILTVSSLYENRVDGGTGHDTITVSTSPNDISGSATGGDGDDTINIFARNTGSDGTFVSRVHGGAGADTFNLDLALVDDTIADDNPERLELFQNTVQVADFDPNEDTLVIDLREIAYSSFQGAEDNPDRLVWTTDPSSNWQLAEATLEERTVVLGFEHPDGSSQTLRVDIGGDVEFSLSDIQILFGDDGESIIIDEDSPSIIETGSGDDTITGSNSSGVDEINTRGGDDTIDVDVDTAIVNAGAGNDVLDVDSYNSTVNGGSGDDTFTGSGARFTWNGDAGDDHMTLDGDTFREEAVYLNGGDGEDTIVSQFGQVQLISEGIFDSYVANTYLSGGDGADEFQLEIFEIDPFTSDYIGEFAVGMVVTDFEPGEDLLVIDPYSNIDNTNSVDAQSVFSGIDLEPTEDGEGTYVIFNYSNADAENDGRVAIQLSGVTGVTLDDIQLVGGPDSAPLAMPA